MAKSNVAANIYNLAEHFNVRPSEFIEEDDFSWYRDESFDNISFDLEMVDEHHKRPDSVEGKVQKNYANKDMRDLRKRQRKRVR